MFNFKGEVVGVNSAIISPTGGNIGIGFAIPSNVVKAIVPKLLIHGKISRPWVGINFQFLTKDIIETLTIKNVNGAIINNIVKNSPAHKAGLEISDIIIQYNHIDLKNIYHLV